MHRRFFAALLLVSVAVSPGQSTQDLDREIMNVAAFARLYGVVRYLYAESVMGCVADHKLGTIVGSPTAGTNGNLALFTVPGGFTISFTGMRVTAHDGRTSHHLEGIQPDVLVTPTIAGMLSGRDEVLEHALTVARD